jgi:hypothetical protein
MLDQLNTAIGFVSVMLLLSMMITVVVQAISGLLDLRGNNLVWGLSNLFEQISPEAKKLVASKGISLSKSTAGKELAKAVTSHPSISSTSIGGIYKAKAIRPDELIMVLQKLYAEAFPPPPAPGAPVPAAGAATAASALSDDAKTLLTSLLTNDVPGTVNNTDAMQKLADEFTKRFPAHQVMLRDALNDIAGKTTQIAAGVDQWFHTVMDRASDRFVRNTRFWTIVGAAVLAFGFQVNSIEIYRKIAKDPTVRSKLVANADTIVQQAQKSLAPLGTTELDKLPDNAQLKQQSVAVKAALTDAKAPSHAGLVNCAQAKDWLSNSNVRNDATVASEFDKACTAAESAQLKSISPDLANIKSQLADADLNLVKEFSLTRRSMTEFGGEFVTLLLLSLGAPFWFNALRQLSNLKPAISNKVADERKKSEGTTDSTPAKAKAAGA